MVLAASLSACSGGSSTPDSTGGNSGDAAPAIPAPKITISPATGSAKVRPDKTVVVTASDGELEEVTVRAGGKTLDGEFDSTHTKWTSRNR